MVKGMAFTSMSCRCVKDEFMRDYERQRSLAKKAAVLDGAPYVLYRKADGLYAFVREGVEFDGKEIEIITQY